MVGGRAVALSVVRSRAARRLSLRLDPAAGAARLTLPPRVSAKDARAFLAAHEDWIATRVAAWPMATPFADGAVFPLEDTPTKIVHEASLPRAPALRDDVLALAATLGRPVAAVAVRDPRGRWGSCSTTARINYAWRLILAPAWVRAGVVAHEVAHLVHFDHSPAFRALEARLSDGQGARARMWLRTHGAGLHWVGRTEPTPLP